MPCVQRTAREKREEYVRQNRIDINLYEGLTDPVEIIKTFHRPKDLDPLKRFLPSPEPVDSIYSHLTPDEAQDLMEYVIRLLKSGDKDQSEEIARCLAAFTDIPLDLMLKQFLSDGLFYPGIIFRKASATIREELIRRLESDLENRNVLLLALGWIGDEEVVNLFSSWKRNPPVWRSALHVPPEEYAEEAGWEVTAEYRRRNLYFDLCYPLQPRTTEKGGPVRVVDTYEGNCQWCGRELIRLFDIELAVPPLTAMPIKAARINIATCDVCTCYGFVFAELNPEGKAQWSGHNKRPDYLPDSTKSWDRMPTDRLILSPEPRPALHAADWLLPTKFSQIGGHPTWVQDAEYPSCPDCRHKMMFFAQFSHDEIEESAEGIFYSFLCTDCWITATSYQQT